MTSISYVYFSSNTAFYALTAIQAVVIIPAWCIAMPKLLGDLMPVLRELLQRRQVERQRLLPNAVPMAFAVALCSGGSAFEQDNQLAAPLSCFDWFGFAAVCLAEVLITLGTSSERGCQLQKRRVPITQSVCF